MIVAMIRSFGTWNYCRFIGINARRRCRLGLGTRSPEAYTLISRPVPTLTSLDTQGGKPENVAEPVPEMDVEKVSKER